MPKKNLPSPQGDYNKLVEKSHQFFSKLPWAEADIGRLQLSGQIETLQTFQPKLSKDLIQKQIVEDSKSTLILCHPQVLAAFEKLDLNLLYKSAKGHSIIDPNNVDRVDAIVQRMLKKRPLFFFTISDTYGIMDRKGLIEGDRNNYPPEGYMNSDEIMWSSLLGLVTPTYAVSCGCRYSNPTHEKSDKLVSHFQMAGIVGIRLERLEHGFYYAKNSAHDDNIKLFQKTMESIHESIPVGSNHILEMQIGIKSHGGIGDLQVLDTIILRGRIIAVVEPYLRQIMLSASDGGNVLASVVGLGLGAFAYAVEKNSQEDYKRLFYQTCMDIMRALNAEKPSNTVLHLRFYISPQDKAVLESVVQGDAHVIVDYFQAKEIEGIQRSCYYQSVAYSNVNGGEFARQAFCYAWDGNSYPGNEYWKGSYQQSGDPVAMYTTLLGTLQNPELVVYQKSLNVSNFAKQDFSAKAHASIEPTSEETEHIQYNTASKPTFFAKSPCNKRCSWFCC